MYQADITTTFSNNQNLVTISFFKYKGTNILWALKEMPFANKPLLETPGLHFFKIMRSGKENGFSLKQEIGVYALVAVWKNRNYAQNFFRTSRLFRGFKNHSKEWWTIYMCPLNSDGKWNKSNPFLPISADRQYDGPIGVFTRTALSPKNMLSFWKLNPGISEIIKEQDGLIFSKVLGENPIFQQATFSLWKTKRDAQLFVYHSKNDKIETNKKNEIVKFNDDLFTEFKILDTDGSWEGIQLLLSDDEKRRSQVVKDLINQTLSAKGN